MQQMNKQIKKYTLAFSLFCSIACAMIFHSQMIQVFIAEFRRVLFRSGLDWMSDRFSWLS